MGRGRALAGKALVLTCPQRPAGLPSTSEAGTQVVGGPQWNEGPSLHQGSLLTSYTHL